MASALERVIKGLPNRSGLNHNIFTVTKTFISPAATDTKTFTLPVSAALIAADVSVNSTGSVSGSTQIAIDNTTQGQTDLDGGQLDVAYNDADGHTSSNVTSSMVILQGNVGDVYTITIDAIPTGFSSAEVDVTLVFVSI